MPAPHSEKQPFYFAGKIDSRAVSMFQLPDSKHQSADNINHTLRFISSNCMGINGFLDRYIGSKITGRPKTQPVFELAKRVHESDTRKATGDLYIKHLFYSAYLVDEMTGNVDRTPDEKDLLVAVSLLHDSIEMKRKMHDTPDYNPSNLYFLLTKSKDFDGVPYMKDWRPRDIRKIVTMISLLTPPDKPPEMEVPIWRDIKRRDFYRIMNLTKEQVVEAEIAIGIKDNLPPITQEEAEAIAQMIKDIKVAEVFANLRETADDIIWQRDGMEEIPEMKHLIDRFHVFAERVEYFKSVPIDTTYKMKMATDLQVLSQLIGNHGFEGVSE